MATARSPPLRSLGIAPDHGAPPLFLIVLVLVLVLDFRLTKPRKIEDDDEDENEHDSSLPGVRVISIGQSAGVLSLRRRRRNIAPGEALRAGGNEPPTAQPPKWGGTASGAVGSAAPLRGLGAFLPPKPTVPLRSILRQAQDGLYSATPFGCSPHAPWA